MTTTRRELLGTGVAATLGAVGTAGCVGAVSRAGDACFDAGSGDATIGFVGDVMLGRGVDRRWRDDDPGGVWGSTLDRLGALDGLVANLECCISDRGEPWPDKTFRFRAAPEFAVPALRSADVSVAALANNHVLDFGEDALADTLAALDGADVAHAGAGMDPEAALAPAVTEIGGLTVATVSLTDRFSPFAATENGAGTAYTRFDRGGAGTRLVVDAALDRARAVEPDLLVASLHWGPNWETEPSDRQQAVARWLVDRGVDVVHGHSAHLLQGVEVYRGRPIVYDAGDFVDDYAPKAEYHNKRSALFELVVAEGQLSALRAVPIEIRDERATLADGDAAEWTRETLAERSAAFGTTVRRGDAGVVVPLEGC